MKTSFRHKSYRIVQDEISLRENVSKKGGYRILFKRQMKISSIRIPALKVVIKRG